MTNYAEDVKNLMSGQRRTLKSRMQFEYALGSKMAQVLETIQNKISDLSAASDSASQGNIEVNGNQIDEKDEENEDEEEENPMLIIEESLAELKLVKDALLGNLDETQLESWLDWKFIEPSPEPKASSTNLPKNYSHRKNLSTSGLPPPKKGPPSNPLHPLD